MKEEIINLAKSKEINFESNFICNKPYKYSNKEDLRWLFWLTELQKFLREKHNILLYVENSNGCWNWVIENNKGYIEGKMPVDEDYSSIYEEQLEVGIYESLKLIKK